MPTMAAIRLNMVDCPSDFLRRYVKLAQVVVIVKYLYCRALLRFLVFSVFPCDLCASLP